MAFARRDIIKALGLGAWAATGGRALAVEGTTALETALAESPLLYLSPLQTNGALSRCQAEVWFQALPGAVVVVTAAEAWRARAVRQGLDRAQLWIGDVGVWQRSNGRYRNLPGVRGTGALVQEPGEQQRILALFGRKYRREWGVWGPRFERGLREGSRVMLRYELDTLET